MSSRAAAPAAAALVLAVLALRPFRRGSEGDAGTEAQGPRLLLRRGFPAAALGCPGLLALGLVFLAAPAAPAAAVAPAALAALGLAFVLIRLFRPLRGGAGRLFLFFFLFAAAAAPAGVLHPLRRRADTEGAAGGRHFRDLHAEDIQLRLLRDARRAGGDVDAVAAALAVAQNDDLAGLISLGGLRRIVEPDGDGFLHQVDGADVAGAVGRLHEGVVFRHAGLGVLIGVLLVFQAAHEAAAGTGDLRGIQAQVLGLGHFDGHGLELVEKALAAEGLAADAQPPQHFRLVAHADLAQLDAGVEHAGQVPHQFTEVHPPVGGEEKDDLVALEAALHVHQLHFQAVLGDLPLADDGGFFFALCIALHGPAVLVGRQADQGAQGLDHGMILHHVVAAHAGAELGPLGGLHHHGVALPDGSAPGVKKIGFTAAAEADADDFLHR